MSKAKIAITLEQAIVKRIDHLVRKQVFQNRSQAIQEAVEDKLEHIDRNRLAKECSKLNQAFEQAMAEEGMSEELSTWPEY